MPTYHYKCQKCELIHEEFHHMREEPSISCPNCGEKCSKTLEGMNLTTYTRGYGYCDRKGCKRDMNLHTLRNNDPYAQHRVNNEQDYIADNLKKAGRHQKNTKYFTPK